MRSRSFLKPPSARAVEFPRARELDAHRIDEMAVDDHLVMKVRACREARHAEIADELPLAHLHAFGDPARKTLHVVVGRDVAVRVLDFDAVAVARFATGLDDGAVAGREDRRADRRGEIDARVHARVAENRVEARTEARGDARGRDRLTHQEFACRAPVLVKIVDEIGRRAFGTDNSGTSRCGS